MKFNEDFMIACTKICFSVLLGGYVLVFVATCIAGKQAVEHLDEDTKERIAEDLERMVIEKIEAKKREASE